MPSRSPFTGRERATLIGVVVLFTMTSFEAMAALAVLPSAAEDLGGVGSFGWVATGFVLAKIVGLVVAGRYSDSNGPRGALTAGLVFLAASSVVCGAAPTMSLLIAGRVVQGLASGLLLTSVYVVIGQVFSDAAMPKVQSAIGATFIVPSLVGPVIAGQVAERTSWRWTFLGLLPFIVLGIALMLPVLRGLHHAELPKTRRNSLPFAIAVAASIAIMELAGQDPPPWPVFIPVSVVAVTLLVWGLSGVLPVGTFRLRRGVAAPIGLRGIYTGAFIAADALIPLSLTLQHGYSATAAGLPLAAGGVAWGVGSWWQSRPPQGDEQEHRIRLVRVGFGLTALGTLAAAAVAYPSVPGWWVLGGWCLAGMGGGMTMTTFNVLVLRHTTDEDRGFDASATQLAGAVGAAVLTAIAGVLIAAADRGTLGFDTAFMSVNVTMAALLIAGMGLTQRLRTPAVREYAALS